MKPVESGPSSMWTGPVLGHPGVKLGCSSGFPFGQVTNTTIHGIPVPWNVSLKEVSAMKMITEVT